MKIVVLSGKAETGKDFIAKTYFWSRGVADTGPTVDPVYRPLRFYPIAQADALKELAIGRQLVSFEEAYVTKPPFARKILQQLGTEEGWQKYGETVWCEMTYARMRRASEGWEIEQFVVTDCRFPHEVEFWRSKGATLLRIFAPDRVEDSKLNKEARAHLSETALDGWDPQPSYPTPQKPRVHYELEPKGPYWDGIIDNRKHIRPDELDYQMTMICRIHDIIEPIEYFGVLPKPAYLSPSGTHAGEL